MPAKLPPPRNTVGRAVGDTGLAGLVNNAGIVVAGPLEILPLDQLRLQLEVNVVGQIAVTQAFLPLLRKARGRIVNMGSLNGRIAAPYLAPYAASKHALEAVNNAMRVELRDLGDPRFGNRARGDDDADLGQIAGCRRRLGRQGQRRQPRLVQGRPRRHAASNAEVGRCGPAGRSVVRCVVHALTARWPYARYPVGLKVNLLLRAYKWIPDRLWDWIVQRSLGLPMTDRHDSRRHTKREA